MMTKINPTSTWLDGLKDLISEHNVHVKSMGFPEDWKERFEKIQEVSL